MKVRYVYCLSCEAPRIRMKRTGNKELVYDKGNVKLYKREYECPNCRESILFDEYKNRFCNK
jgi:hypothetical protein